MLLCTSDSLYCKAFRVCIVDCGDMGTRELELEFEKINRIFIAKEMYHKINLMEKEAFISGCIWSRTVDEAAPVLGRSVDILEKLSVFTLSSCSFISLSSSSTICSLPSTIIDFVGSRCFSLLSQNG